MAQTVVTELLKQFAQILRNEIERFNKIRSSMNFQLDSFNWEDPIFFRLKTQYYEELKLIEKTLIPAMRVYQQYFIQLLEQIRIYSEDFDDRVTEDQQKLDQVTDISFDDDTNDAKSIASMTGKNTNFDYKYLDINDFFLLIETLKINREEFAAIRTQLSFLLGEMKKSEFEISRGTYAFERVFTDCGMEYIQTLEDTMLEFETYLNGKISPPNPIFNF